MEKVRKLLPGRDGVLPQKFFSKESMDALIQGLQKKAVDMDLLVNMIGMSGKTKTSDTLLVGFDYSHGDIAVLIIGRKEPDGKIQILNQFQGKAAEELYRELVTKNGLHDTENHIF